MRNASLTAALLGLCLLSATSHAVEVDVGVSVQISQPGVYGRIDIGRYPQPQLVLGSPVLIQRERVSHEPVYLWVPPGHQKNWRKHCARYQACGVPVYFVQEDWYQREVVGARGEPKGKSKGRGHGHGHGKDRD
jgi:hypothetical protein